MIIKKYKSYTDKKFVKMFNETLINSIEFNYEETIINCLNLLLVFNLLGMQIDDITTKLYHNYRRNKI